jgi:lipopolysaccharide export LptBFGC system permease protein LptF
MRACGVSLYRTAAPLFLLSLLWSGALFLLEEHVLAESNHKAIRLEDTIRGRPPRAEDIENRNWLAGTEGRLYYYEGFDSRENVLFG